MKRKITTEILVQQCIKKSNYSSSPYIYQQSEMISSFVLNMDSISRSKVINFFISYEIMKFYQHFY